MKKVVPVIIAIVVLGAGAAYYFVTRNNASDESGTSQTGNTQNADTTTTPQATSEVSIEGLAFSPINITVKKGTKVTWSNEDEMVYDITETDGKEGPKSGNLADGQSYSFTYDTVGTFKYNCSLHPSMTGSVTVTE